MQMHAFAGAAAFLLAPLIMPLQTSAALEYSKKLTGEAVGNTGTASEDVWSGSKADLLALVKNAKDNYGTFENAKHLGRNATMLIPATLNEMRKSIARGDPNSYNTTFWDGAHSQSADSDDWDITWFFKSFGSGVEKYVNANGDEAVYDSVSGKCLTNTKLGTKNHGKNGLWSATFGEHSDKDMMPNKTKSIQNDRFSKDGDQYKYVGILYETDPRDPNKFYVVDGQTGRRMTKRQAEEFPTTLSDMWKDMGLTCVRNDAVDIVDPKKLDEKLDHDLQSELSTAEQTIDLKSLDLKDENYDWCKCADPGCVAKSMMGMDYYVSFICTKCGKVNRTYAKRVLEMERKLKEKGIDTIWIGDNAEEKARSAVK